MLKLLALLSVATTALGTASAAEDCIENSAGQLVCGEDAEIVRARIEAEDRLSAPGIDAPAGEEPEDDGWTTSRNVVRGAIPAAQVSTAAQEEATRAPQDYAQNDPIPDSGLRQRGRGYGSVYNAYGPTLFLRGGYAFEGDGNLPDSSALGFSVGYRNYFSDGGRAHWGWETELLYGRDSEDIAGLDVTSWMLAALLGLRWQYDLTEHVMPFASAAVGPGYVKDKVEGLFEDDDITFVYTARAGLEIPLTAGVSAEGAYRFLGTTEDGTPMFHAAEIALNFDLN